MVVDRVNVRVLEYDPVRSASLAPIVCLKLTVTDSLEVGAVQLLSSVGAALPPTGANAPPAFACRACGNENVPLTRCPVATDDGSATLKAASPAVEITFALVCAK